MSDSAQNIDQISTSSSQKEVTANANFDAASPATIFGRRASTSSGLVLGYYGGRLGGTSVANGTVTATASNTNYVVAHRSTLVVSISTANTNWNNTTTYGRMYKLTAGGSSITSYEDHRAGTSGILTPDAAGSFQPLDSDLTTIAALTATTDNFMQAKSSAWASRTPTQATADLIAMVGDSGSGGTKGLVPAPGAGDAAAGKFLKADGTFAVPPGSGGGGWTLLESQTASNSATLDFSSWYSSTYDEYIVEVVGLIPQNSGVHLSVRLSTDGGSTYDTFGNYSYSTLESSNAGSGVGGSDGLTGWVFMRNISNNSNYEHHGQYRLYKPASARYKSFNGSGIVLTGSHPETQIASGHYTNLTAYDAIRFFMSSGNLVAGDFRIYGVEK